MRFTDYYAEASCTAGRANFITGELADPHRLTTVGQAGVADRHAGASADHRHGAQVDGLCDGQFGKNHLGDLNKYLPTVHGFDEFFGYLYHLDAMEDPAHPQLPAGPEGHGRSAQHGPQLGDHDDDTTVQPRWGKVGKQKIEDAGTLYPKRMETVDDEILDARAQVHRQGQGRRQAVLPVAQPHAHARRHAPVDKYEACATPKTAGRSTKPAWRSSTTSSARS